jgi:hypothetical protein
LRKIIQNSYRTRGGDTPLTSPSSSQRDSFGGSHRVLRRVPSGKGGNGRVNGGGVSQVLRSIREERKRRILDRKTKVLAWVIFLVFFIEAGTLGLLPKQMYFVYRSVRLSDMLILGLIIYSLFNLREYLDLYKSRMMVIVKVILLFFAVEFAISAVRYEFNIVEYFFRLKAVWASLMIFPYMLLVKRGGLPYFIKIVLPVAIVSNVLYIMSALTGIAFLPDTRIEEFHYAGGLKVYRVYGGTFFGELFFLFFVFKWITDRFRLRELFLAILFVLPHILALGRQAWVSFAFTILFMFAWNMLKKHSFQIAIKQVFIMIILGAGVIYMLTRLAPASGDITEALGERFAQGQEDVKEEKGTYGSRLEKNKILLELWLSSTTNTLIGIGYHPLWTNAPVTQEEVKYYEAMWDVNWAGILVSYGIIGFLLYALYQVLYIYYTGRILRRTQETNLFTFFTLLMLSGMLNDSLINFSYGLLSLGRSGLGLYSSFVVAIVIFEFERIRWKRQNSIEQHAAFNAPPALQTARVERGHRPKV